MSDTPGKIPPQNLDAEQSMLGGVLLGGSAVDQVISIVRSEDFYDQKHQAIFSAVSKLSEKGEAIDSLTVINKLKSDGLLDMAGGAGYISSLADSMPTAAHAADYARIVRDKAVLRQLIDLGTKVVQDSFDEKLTTENILEKTEKQIFDITSRNQKGGIQSVKELVKEVYEKYQLSKNNPDPITGLRTGFHKIDEYTSGFQPGELVIIGARPGIGKTSLALNFAYSLATAEKKKNVLIFSLEMSALDLTRRLVALGAKVDIVRLRSGKYTTADENERIRTTLGILSDAPILMDISDNTVLDIRAKARTAQAKLKRDGKNLDLIIIDYLQLIRAPEGKEYSRQNREQQISFISRSLKLLTKEIDCPVIALSQLNRETERREKPMKSYGKGVEGQEKEKKQPPRLSDIRESGAIEQDADIVMFIDRDSDPKPRREHIAQINDYKDILNYRLIIAKNRNGPTGDQEVAFIPSLTLFVEMAKEANDTSVPGAF